MEEKRLRSGFTTGACATAAARAAAVFLLRGTLPERVEVILPEGQSAVWKPEYESEEPCQGYLRVQKDAGDDPDVTHGSWVYACVTILTEAELETKRQTGSGYWLEEYPEVYLDGGIGIGIVTKPGLSCPVGHYAINPVPRKMILSAVDAERDRLGFRGCLGIQIAIPSGVELAKKTFNPKLGIQGGISVLGTTGIVKPMSEEALLATIRLDIHMKTVANENVLLMAPGNYGETFLREAMGIPMGEAVLCSNFVADSMQMLREENVRELLFVSHIGKLIKVSAGIPDTHSKYGDRRMEEMARLTALRLGEQEKQEEQENQDLLDRILGSNTTDEALEHMNQARVGLAEQILTDSAESAKIHLERWAGGTLHAEVVTFSSALGITGKSSGADAMFRKWKIQKPQS
ncbi:cobalt-precorrin-5B (C(1))-methyltransferase CbiD [Brotaphodocola catenula]|uniref:Cobalt-precorrin-5B C(1)-methyltransferase n=1 Tax=Brotaphodocola catenula TaxID=2885361 RepID=A0AAE3ARF7_9FIRM|nr:cobalt-precorrin-5B (C(1))-methyltransferase CbiD [Brotaphodocola catenula]MCC2165446.1 cobalt-precorrin-5B (C(1))-methyltransferase CbiD [Brotaphodocola catenula]